MKSFYLFFIGMALWLTACQKDNIDEIIPEDPGHQIDTIDVNPLLSRMSSLSPDSLNLACLAIPFPVDFVQASGNILTVTSEEELEAAFMNADSIVDFVYPFEAVGNNEVLLIESIEDLVAGITSCSTYVPDCSTDQDGHVLLFFNALNILTLNRYVYTINYPVTLMVEGNPVTIQNYDEYLPAVGGTPFNLLEAELVYPVTIDVRAS